MTVESLFLKTDTGHETGTVYHYDPSDNGLVIETRDGLGHHSLTLAGHEVFALRALLNTMAPRRKK